MSKDFLLLFLLERKKGVNMYQHLHNARVVICLFHFCTVSLIVFSLLSHVWLFSDPMDCSPPGSSVHEISRARILEWVAISFSRASSWTMDQTQVSWIAGRFFTAWARNAINNWYVMNKLNNSSFLMNNKKETCYTSVFLTTISYLQSLQQLIEDKGKKKNV